MSGKPYTLYTELFYYRRLHPETLPDTRAVKLWASGHDTTYGSALWISLIQYIGDNTRNNMFLDFLYPVVEKITELHPHFPNPYIIATLLAPTIDKDSPEYESHLRLGREALKIGEKGIAESCDSEKIENIKNADVTSALWIDQTLKNPCKDGMLPYYTADVAERIGEKDKAEIYYKIASMNDDAPESSRFLMILTKASEGDHLSAAKRFLLVALGGYDESPYTCQESIALVTKKMANREIVEEEDLPFLKEKEKTLVAPKDTKNPLSSSVSGCYESGTRAIKQLYLAYIDNKTKNYPNITTGSGLIASGILISIPTLENQKGWNIRKKDGIWKYTNY